jgi:hypothetical protein
VQANSHDSAKKANPSRSRQQCGCSGHAESNPTTEGSRVQVANEYIGTAAEQRKQVNLAERLKELMGEELRNHEHFEKPQHTSIWAQWCKEIGRKGSQTLEDDDLAIEAGGEFRSLRCTLTQKHIFDLKEPVEDSHEYIWEKEAILQYIREHGGSAQNPAMPSVCITQGELKPARRVLRAAAERRRKGAVLDDSSEDEIL